MRSNWVPSAITLANFVAGFAGTLAAANENFDLCLIAVLLGLVLDALDGQLARALHSQSHLGAQLDSFADVVTFATLPSACIFCFWVRSTANSLGSTAVGFIFSMLYAGAGLVRLARFNVRNSAHSHDNFLGLPMPPLGILLISIVCLADQLQSWLGRFAPHLVIAIAVGAGAPLMLSTVVYQRITLKSDLSKRVLCCAVAATSTWLVFRPTTYGAAIACVIGAFLFMLQPIIVGVLAAAGIDSKRPRKNS